MSTNKFVELAKQTSEREHKQVGVGRKNDGKDEDNKPLGLCRPYSDKEVEGSSKRQSSNSANVTVLPDAVNGRRRTMMCKHWLIERGRIGVRLMSEDGGVNVRMYACACERVSYVCLSRCSLLHAVASKAVRANQHADIFRVLS